MTYVTLEEVVALARTTIGTSDKQDEPLFKQWAWEGLQDVGLSTDSIEVCTLKPKNFIAGKPENCRALIDIALYDANGNEFAHSFKAGKKRIYPNRTFPLSILATDGLTQIPTIVDVSEDRFNIIIGSNGSHVTAIMIRYWSYPVDANGLPLIQEDEKMALVHFIKWMWSMRKNDNRSEIEQNRQTWYLASDRARAKKKNISNETVKTIVRNWMQLINKTNFQQF